MEQTFGSNKGISHHLRLAQLRHILSTYFDEGEFRSLCFDLGITYDNLPAIGLGNKARELVRYSDRHGRLDELVAVVISLRPHVEWGAMEDGCHAILVALAYGAPREPKESNEALEEAHTQLREWVLQRLVGYPQAEFLLAQYEANPAVWEAPLKAALQETACDVDEGILQVAYQLFELPDRAAAPPPKFNPQFQGNVQGVVIGDNNTVTLTFGNATAKE